MSETLDCIKGKLNTFCGWVPVAAGVGAVVGGATVLLWVLGKRNTPTEPKRDAVLSQIPETRLDDLKDGITRQEIEQMSHSDSPRLGLIMSRRRFVVILLKVFLVTLMRQVLIDFLRLVLRSQRRMKLQMQLQGLANLRRRLLKKLKKKIPKRRRKTRCKKKKKKMISGPNPDILHCMLMKSFHSLSATNSFSGEQQVEILSIVRTLGPNDYSASLRFNGC
jgi:hypothetical protein